MRERSQLYLIGAWITDHFRQLARETSVHAVASRLRKQGIPIEIALRILCGRTPRA